jgi:hypothetical protein
VRIRNADLRWIRYLVGLGKDGVAFLIGEEEGGGDEQGLDRLAQPTDQLRLGGKAVPQLHAQAQLGQRVRHQSEPSQHVTLNKE